MNMTNDQLDKVLPKRRPPMLPFLLEIVKGSLGRGQIGTWSVLTAIKRGIGRLIAGLKEEERKGRDQG